MPTNDAGDAVEEVAFEDHRFVLFYHRIGRTFVLGSYDGPISDAQIVDLLDGADRDAGRTRASVEFKVNGDTDLSLNVGLDDAAHHN